MVTALTHTIRIIDPGAFIKERGFIPGDSRRCRADRGSGARHGFYSLKKEYEMLPTIAETTADPRSFGFRMHRSTQDARQYAYCCLGGKYSAKWVLEG
ncbi:MAG: DUF2102 domain-containing protein, partial [Euryarchaeota archaeon]|nr:DUF2102 domain-containing protein [Euryarchaeota archaeon]